MTRAEFPVLKGSLSPWAESAGQRWRRQQQQQQNPHHKHQTPQVVQQAALSSTIAGNKREQNVNNSMDTSEGERVNEAWEYLFAYAHI